MKETKRLSVGVYLATDVLEYLALLEGQLGCSRSFLVNTIIRRFSQTEVEREAANVGVRARTDEALKIINI